MFLIIDIYRLGVVYPYLSTSISLDECDYYRYISHIIINVINNDEEIYIAIYLPKKFPDVVEWIFVKHDTKIMVLGSDINVDDTESGELAEDLLSIVTIFTARHNGL